MTAEDTRKPAAACGCGHDHGPAGTACCGHDHDQAEPAGHDHGATGAACCGHDHGGRVACPCGHDAVGGVGHDRAMGRLSFALLGGILIVNSFLLEWWLPAYGFAATLSAIVGAFVLAFPIVVTAVRDLIQGKVYMNELVALAILAALAQGNYQSELGSGSFQTAGIIAFFLLITIIIETRTASGAQRSIEELIKLTPNVARRLRDGVEEEVSVTELAIGDRIVVRPGENFPVDARIVKGESTVNQASITGESLPLDKSGRNPEPDRRGGAVGDPGGRGHHAGQGQGDDSGG